MAEININDYVRDRDGFIVKVNEIQEYKEEDDSWYQEKTLKGTWKSMIVNHSKNIIDLVEVGDYVNGREVKHIAMFEGFPDYPKLIFVDETHLIPDDTCENDEIQTILTKESYMANCYKVGGEKDEASND